MTPDAHAPLPDVPATTAVPLLAGRYHILDKLGEGGMGAVFRARDARLDRAVAVKMLPEGSAPDAGAVARFRREVKALARLTHPGIIQAYDSGEEAGRPFLVMELVEGHSLAARVREQGRVSPPRAADFGYQAALALHHAHTGGLVHRDVKPSNLLLASDGRVRLLDLGLARFLQDQIGEAALTRTGTGMGTPDYCPPEQFRDARKADVRSDVYALGCTLYHLIAGRVPFPGSSFSEKVEAHEAKEPAPLEELCPEVPAGLALTVRRMMAKRPADRFQTMAEVAEALMPHVAGSSASFPHIRHSATWDGHRLATVPALRRRRRRVALAAAGAVLAVLLVAGTVLVAGRAAGWFRSGGPPVALGDDLTPGEPGKKPALPGTGKSPSPDSPPKKEPRDPNVLTVSQKPEDGGTYRKIGAALEAARPGQTIRVLDGGVYRETLRFTGPNRHAGVTLEAPHGAVLERDRAGGVVLYFIGAPNVSVRGFRLRAQKAERATLIGIQGNCPGMRLESLDLSSDGERTTNGIEVIGNDAGTEREPIIIQGCTFRGLGIAAHVGGGPRDLAPSIALRDCRFVDCILGAKITGCAARLQIVGNRFSGLLMAAIQFEMLTPESEDILIANNSFSDCAAVFRLWDSKAKGKGVRLRNNLLLASQGRDMYFLEADSPFTPRGPGDGTAVAKAYDFGHNWREGRKPTGAIARGWIPPDPKKGDVLKEKIDGVNREPNSPDFLRPDPKSPLATAGAGNEDPALPRYVGALPPAGTDPWDWDRAWRMPKGARLVTVSQDSRHKARYDTIRKALADARPWDTIRVLDGGVYDETVALKGAKKYTGVTLEAVNGATLRLAGGANCLVVVEDAPHARLAGFTLTDDETGDRKQSRALVSVSGAAAGVTLTRLKLQPRVPMFGVLVKSATAEAGAPLRVERCEWRPRPEANYDGISIVGTNEKQPTTNVCVRNNRLFACFRGINVWGTVRDIHVTGNLLVKCRACGIQVEDLSPETRGVLIANNTAFGGTGCFRCWDNVPYEAPVAGQVEVANNLFFQASFCDVAYILDPGMGKDQSPGDGKTLVKLWHFHHNCRDFSGGASAPSIPPGDENARLKADDLLADDADHLDRVRPVKDSPLATQGAGANDGSLPTYIGALPREGDPTWSWDRTWRARVRMTRSPPVP